MESNAAKPQTTASELTKCLNQCLKDIMSTQTDHCKLHNGTICCRTLLVGCITLYTAVFIVSTPVNAFQAWEDFRQLDSSFQCKNSFCHQLWLRTAGESLFISCKKEENCLCCVIFFKKVLWFSSFESKSVCRHLRLARQNSKYSFWYRKYLISMAQSTFSLLLKQKNRHKFCLHFTLTW